MARSVLQDWVQELSLMQQSVLISAVRGPDGQPKYAPPKMLIRWYRRCVLISALDGEVLDNPVDPRGGSFTGPSINLGKHSFGFVEDNKAFWFDAMGEHITEYIRNLDGIPSHFSNHFRDAIEVVGFKHPDEIVRHFWNNAYHRLVRDLNLHPETVEQMDKRLGDNRNNWLANADEATRR